MGKWSREYFPYQDAACFGVALANYLLVKESHEYATESLRKYRKHVFVEEDGEIEQELMPGVVRDVTNGLYIAKLTTSRPTDYLAIAKDRGSSAGLLIRQEEEKGNIIRVARVSRAEPPCIVLMTLPGDVPHAMFLRWAGGAYVHNGDLVYFPRDEFTIHGIVEMQCTRENRFPDSYEPYVWEF